MSHEDKHSVKGERKRETRLKGRYESLLVANSVVACNSALGFLHYFKIKRHSKNGSITQAKLVMFDWKCTHPFQFKPFTHSLKNARNEVETFIHSNSL